MSHFVVLKSVTRHGIVVHDPACGQRACSSAEASKHLTGIALELAPAEGFIRKDERSRLPVSVFWSHLSGSGHALVQVLILSVLLQALALAAPFYMQLTLDEVVARGDVDLLLVLALGFALLVVIKTASTAVRSLILLVLQNVLHFHLGARFSIILSNSSFVLRKTAHRRFAVSFFLPCSLFATCSRRDCWRLRSMG